MLLLPQVLILALTLVPAWVSAAIFPSDTLVKTVDANGFKKAMKENTTSVVAFVAPWCGHCQRMAPEYSKAAKNLHPLIPLYAVDCDKQENKPLCAQQGVQGFPTVKLFPRGGRSNPIVFNQPERTAKAFYQWASTRIPHGVKTLKKVDDFSGWLNNNIEKPRAVLLTEAKNIPLLWQTLGNKFKDNIKFAAHRDQEGNTAETLGLPKDSKSSKVLVYPPGSSDFAQYDGVLKYDPLSKFFKKVADGKANLKIVKKDESTESGTDSTDDNTHSKDEL